MTSAETEIAVERIPPGIYHIVVASHGAFIHERLTDREHQHVTIAPPSAKPDPSQRWEVRHGRKPDTITIQRPGNIRPPLSLTYKGAPHPKPGARVEVHREEFPTDWELDHAPGHRYYIRVPRFHHAEADAAESAIPGRPLGIAVGPEKIAPPFLNINHEHQLEWVFERVSHHGLEEEA